MKFTNEGSISSFFTIIIALLTVSSAANPKDTKPAASRAEKSYTQHAYGSNDYDTDYYAGQQPQTHIADERFYSILLNDVSEVRRQLTETESAIMAALPGLAALFGVVALAYAQANDHNNQRNSINDALNRIGQTETEQTSICNSVNQLARINLALTAEADVGGGTLTAAGIATQLNLIENAINMINAPTCA